MPSFSFDEDEFGGGVQPVSMTDTASDNNDPFAGGIASTNISLDDLTSPTSVQIVHETIVESQNNNENLVTDSVEVPYTDESITTTFS